MALEELLQMPYLHDITEKTVHAAWLLCITAITETYMINLPTY